MLLLFCFPEVIAENEDVVYSSHQPCLLPKTQFPVKSSSIPTITLYFRGFHLPILHRSCQERQSLLDLVTHLHRKFPTRFKCLFQGLPPVYLRQPCRPASTCFLPNRTISALQKCISSKYKKF